MDLRYQWFQRGQPVGRMLTLQLKHGDLYIMSDLAVGWNWRHSSELTLRHSAGAPKYTALPKPKTKPKPKPKAKPSSNANGKGKRKGASPDAEATGQKAAKRHKHSAESAAPMDDGDEE